MTYRDILKNQLRRRQELNPKYSLRSFASRLEISPSKLSEIMSGKKRLSVERAEMILSRLGLEVREAELFVLSVQVESSVKTKSLLSKEEMKRQIQALTSELNAGRTTRRNAWYFGAVNALDDIGVDPREYHRSLGVSSHQVEAAQRYRSRMAKFHSERREISYEPVSILKKVEEEQIRNDEMEIRAEYAFLTQAQALDLQKRIRSLILTYKSKNKNSDPEDLTMIHWGNCKILKK